MDPTRFLSMVARISCLLGSGELNKINFWLYVKSNKIINIKYYTDKGDLSLKQFAVHVQKCK